MASREDTPNLIATPENTLSSPSPSPALKDTIYHINDLRADPTLAETLTTFLNIGFRDSNAYPADRWDVKGDRFSSSSEFLQTLEPEGLIAVVYSGSVPVACAAAVRWIGDQTGFSRPGEGGFEIRAVTVKIGEAKKGLASRAVSVLQEYLVARERESRGGVEGKLSLWIHTAECVNGEYWRRRGFRDDRVYEQPVGYWSSLTGFRMLVLVKEVDL